MENKKNITRREAIKKMGLSTLALSVGPETIKAITPDLDPTKDPQMIQKKDLEFTSQWAQAMFAEITEQNPEGNLMAVNMREVMRKCSRICYDKHSLDKEIKEADLDDFLGRAHKIFGWDIDYDTDTGKMVVYENNTECLCPLARACKGKVAESLCICTETELERIFSRAYGGKVTARVVESVLKGNASCIYHIQLEGK